MAIEAAGSGQPEGGGKRVRSAAPRLEAAQHARRGFGARLSWRLRLLTAQDRARPRMVDAGAGTSNLLAAAARSGRQVHKLIPRLREALSSDDPVQCLEGARGTRELLSGDRDPPIDEVIASGMVPLLISKLGPDTGADLLTEAAWCLTNLASGTSAQTVALVRAGAVEPLVVLLGHEDEEVRDLAIWALGNIAGDSVPMRDMVLEAGALPVLLDGINPTASSHFLKDALWMLSNLCSGDPKPALEQVQPALEPLSAIMFSQNTSVKHAACRVLTCFTYSDSRFAVAVLDAGILPQLIAVLGAPKSALVKTALRALGMFVVCEDAVTQRVVDGGAVAPIAGCLSHGNTAVQIEACWALSNITAGTPEQIQAVQASGALKQIAGRLLADSDWPEESSARLKLRKEMTWVLANAVSGGEWAQLQELAEADVAEALAAQVSRDDTPVVTSVAMEALQELVRMSVVHLSEHPDTNGIVLRLRASRLDARLVDLLVRTAVQVHAAG